MRPATMVLPAMEAAVHELFWSPDHTSQRLSGDQTIVFTTTPSPPGTATVRTSPDSRSTTRTPLGTGAVAVARPAQP